ncbi:10175_t:CDS:2, partial [Cetraspora pellucida]
QLKQIRSLHKCEQLKVLYEIKNDPSAMLNHVIPAFVRLNDNDFNCAIKQICEFWEINTQIQRKHNDMIIQISLSTLAWWNKEVAALSFSQNCPKENSSWFFRYGIMVDKSIRDEKKVLIICFSH